MKNFMIIYVLIIFTLHNFCTSKNNNNLESNNRILINDSTVHEIKNGKGKIIVRWGNYNTDDRNTNFKHYFYYDSIGLLIKEKNYWFNENNKNCIITDTSEYDLLIYSYKNEKGKTELEFKNCFGRNYDDNGKFIGRKLYYIEDVINNKEVYLDVSMGELKK